MSGLYRTATAAERAHYRGVLYPLQDRILRVAATYGGDLVLTGGTALARCYFDHRYSEDVDLFTLLPHAGILGRDFANALRSVGLRVDSVTESASFMRCMVSDGPASIQVDVAPDVPRVEEPAQRPEGYFVHGLRDLAANKVAAFESRSEAKDAIDLYYLAHRVSWNEMFGDAEKKRVPIAYGDLEHFLETPLSGVALVTREITDEDFERFVTSLRVAVTENVKKKVREQRHDLNAIAASLLWDTPPELRTINERTRDVLRQRAARLPLPQRIVLMEALAA